MLSRFSLPILAAALCISLGCDQKSGPAGGSSASGASSSGGSAGKGTTAAAATNSAGMPATAVISDRTAGEVKAEKPKGATPEAKKVLDDWYAAIKSAKSLTAETQAAISESKGGVEVQGDREAYRFAAERPNKIALRQTQGSSFSLVSDGKQFFQIDHKKKVYVLDPPLASLDDLRHSVVFSQTNLQQGLVLVGDALSGSTLDAILAPFQSVEFIGLEEVDGVKQNHLRALRDGVRVDLWFDAAAPFALRKFQPNGNDIAAKNNVKLPEGTQWKMSVGFDKWAYDAAVPADLFKIDPPSDAEKLQNLDDPLALTLVGKPAPQFEGKLLDGSTFKLADQKGKIVVLDFWATWCPPCVAGLPKLAEMTAKHKADGVVFFPVNLQEEPATVKEFLEAKKLTLPIVMDDGKILTLYKVEPVPQTVFIDRQGVVQVVHIGIGELEKIPEQLADLIAGKSLAAAKPAEKK